MIYILMKNLSQLALDVATVDKIKIWRPTFRFGNTSSLYPVA